jgi:hypothetical protein
MNQSNISTFKTDEIERAISSSNIYFKEKLSIASLNKFFFERMSKSSLIGSAIKKEIATEVLVSSQLNKITQIPDNYSQISNENSIEAIERLQSLSEALKLARQVVEESAQIEKVITDLDERTSIAYLMENDDFDIDALPDEQPENIANNSDEVVMDSEFKVQPPGGPIIEPKNIENKEEIPAQKVNEPIKQVSSTAGLFKKMGVSKENILKAAPEQNPSKSENKEYKSAPISNNQNEQQKVSDQPNRPGFRK